MARAYVNAHRAKGKNVYVHKKDHQRFVLVERRLSNLGISLSKYSAFVVSSFLDWFLAKGMNRVPVNTFLGEASLDRYLESIEKTGRDDIASMSSSALIEACEYEVASLYIAKLLDGTPDSFNSIATTIATPKQWKEYRASQERTEELVRSTIRMFRLQFRLNGAKLESYEDVAVELMRRD